MSIASSNVDLSPAAPNGKTGRRGYKLRPRNGLFDLDLSDVWRFRELLGVLMKRDIQVLYRQAFLGIAWAVIQPVFAVTIFTIVFGHFAKISTGDLPYSVFAFAGVLCWTYFAESVRRSSTGLVNDSELVRKVYFPRLIILFSGILSPLIEFAIGFVLLMGLVLWNGITPSWHLLAVAPLVLMAGLLALAMGLWLGPLNVRFRDIKHTLPFMLQVWLYASPIVYPLNMVPEKWQWLYALNPMVGVIDGFRWAIFGIGELPVEPLAIGLVVIAALLGGGLVFFKRMEAQFADVI
jgi:homopolymeric O-antigen transport system permease protein